MISQGSIARRAFNAIWRRTGQPSLSLIHPISTWSLPTNISYNPHADHFVHNITRSVVRVDWTTQPATTVNFVAKSGRSEVALDVPGQTTIYLIDVQILWSAEIFALIKTAWGIAISGKLYRARQWNTEPVGAAKPAYITISLQERSYASP